MATDARQGRPRWSPVLAASVGAVAVVVLLSVPIFVLGPGDHETRSCGNALSSNLQPWHTADRLEPGARYAERAFRVCTSQRINRVAQSVGVLALTGLLVTVMVARRRGQLPGRGG